MSNPKVSEPPLVSVLGRSLSESVGHGKATLMRGDDFLEIFLVDWISGLLLWGSGRQGSYYCQTRETTT